MKKFFILLILLLTCLFLAGRYYYTIGLNINEYIIKDKELPKGFDGRKIVHFSDILYDAEISNLELLVNTINEQNADIVVFTGDLLKEDINNATIEEITNYLKNIKCSLFKYAILGDYDNKTSEKILTDSDFIILNNENKLIYSKDSTPIEIIGGDNINEEVITNELFNIALIHQPDDFSSLNEYDINVFLAGHSLGGQIRMPFINGILNNKGAQIYTNDYYNENDSKLYISYGLGNEKINIRLFNKPSINIYRLYNE